MSMSIKARNGYAKIMTAFTKRFLAEGLEAWKGEEDMIACTRGDAKDYRTISKLLRTKGAKETLKFARNLDTLARDHIPDQIWDAMERDEDAEAQTRQEWNDDITKRHIIALEDQRDCINRQIETAKNRLGVRSNNANKI